MQTTPYINFQGKCREAMEFYRDTLGGEITGMFTYGESPMADDMPPESHDGVMHCHLLADGAEIMGADGPPTGATAANNVQIALMIDDAADGERIFAALAAGGSIGMEMQQTFWVERFGMCVDRYGVGWLVNAGKQAEMPAGA